MTSPLHAFPPVAVRRPAEVVHDRLTADPQGLVVAASAEALHQVAPLLRRWGLVTSALPTVTAGPTPDGGLGSLHIRWRGHEPATGWPAMDAWLLVTPGGPATSTVTLVTTRTPARGLGAPRLGALHRQQAAEVGVTSFLHALVGQLEHDPVQRLQPTGAAR